MSAKGVAPWRLCRSRSIWSTSAISSIKIYASLPEKSSNGDTNSRRRGRRNSCHFISAYAKACCIAFNIFMTGDVEAARRLVREKAELRKIELAAGERHFDRLREGRAESIETSSLHLDVLRDLKRIHSHICSVAYPVLEAAGDLPTRAAVASETVADASAADLRP